MVKGKVATVIGPSEAQDDGSQSTATSFARPVEHGSDVCMRSFFILCEGAFLISSHSDWLYLALRNPFYVLFESNQFRDQYIA